jgi:hypothetical protein
MTGTDTRVYVETDDPEVLAEHQGGQSESGRVQFRQMRDRWRSSFCTSTEDFSADLADGVRYRLVFDSPEAAGRGLADYAAKGARVRWVATDGVSGPSIVDAEQIATNLESRPDLAYRIVAASAAPERPARGLLERPETPAASEGPSGEPEQGVECPHGASCGGAWCCCVDCAWPNREPRRASARGQTHG